MTQRQTILDSARVDAQNLHKKISANNAKAGAAIWADVQAEQADAVALVAKMKTVVQGDVASAKAGIKAAIGKLESAAKLGEDKASAVKDNIRRVNTIIQDSALKAVHSLSEAVAETRMKVAGAAQPKKASA